MVAPPPPPPPEPGVNVTATVTSLPPPGPVGCTVRLPLQVTPPFEQTVLETDTVKLVGAVPPVSLTVKKQPVGWMVNGPEPETETSTFNRVPARATGLGATDNCDCANRGANAITTPAIR